MIRACDINEAYIICTNYVSQKCVVNYTCLSFYYFFLFFNFIIIISFVLFCFCFVFWLFVFCFWRFEPNRSENAAVPSKIADFMLTTFFHLKRFLKTLADNQCSSLTSSIYHIKYVTHSYKTLRKSPEHFLRYRAINMSQINRKQRNFQEKYWLFMGETLSEYDKWYIILSLRISAFSSSTNLTNYFLTLTAGFVGVGHI